MDNRLRLPSPLRAVAVRHPKAKPSMTDLLWPYEKAAAYVQALGLQSTNEFTRWAAGKDPVRGPRPVGFPSNPHQAYSEWRGIAAFLGTDRVAGYKRRFLAYEKARAFVVRLELQGHAEWTQYAAGEMPWLGTRPENIPSNPDIVYRDAGWCGIRHWLGTGGPVETGRTRMVPYEEAKKFAQQLGIAGLTEWRRYANGDIPHLPPRPASIPSSPQVTYRKRGWKGWGDFLGTGNAANFAREFLSYREARAHMRPHKLEGMLAWRAWCRAGKRPANIPGNPEKTYSTEWRGWADFLGIDQRAQRMRRGAAAKARYLAARSSHGGAG